MGDNDVNMPGVDKPAEAVAETAKLGQDLVELTKGGGQWASAVLGTLPHDVVGILGDKVRAYRIERAYELRQRVMGRLAAKGYQKPEELNAPPSLLLPILEAAVDEDREELQSLWEKLLAAASAPETRAGVRHSYIKIVKELDPPDALVLQDAPVWTSKFDWANDAAGRLKLPIEEIRLSVRNLKEAGLIVGMGGAAKGAGGEQSGYSISDLGKLFLRAVA